MFFKQIKYYVVFFISFGLWSSYPNSKYRLLIDVCSFLWMSIVFLSLFLAYYLDKIFPFDSVTNTISNLLYIFLMMTYFITVAESYSQKEAQKNLIQNISRVDFLFSTKLKVKIPYKKEKCELLIRCSAFVSIVVFVNLLFCTYRKNTYFNFMYATMFSNFVICLRIIQMIFFVHLLRNRLILINKELKNIQNEFGIMQTVGKNRREFKNQNTGSDKQRWTLNNLSKIDRIINAKHIYSELTESFELINKAFGCSLTMITTQSFTKFTANFYWGYFCVHDLNDLIIYALLFPTSKQPYRSVKMDKSPNVVNNFAILGPFHWR